MSGRARLKVLALGLLFLISAPAVPAQAAESRGAATHDGWWNRLQGPPENEPAPNPVQLPVPALPKLPTVPDDAIAAGATAGQVDKVAAVGIDLALADGATLDGLVLRLKESEASGANVGADKAKVVACPATIPWGPGQNASWRDRPAADCSLGSAEGVRAADGIWTFDLAAIGQLWADPFAPLAANGVVLAVDPAASPSAQVSWLNFDSGNVAVELTATPSAPAPAADLGPYAPESAATPAPTGPSLEGAAGSTAFPAAGGALGANPLAYPSGQAAGAGSPAATDVPAAEASPQSPAEAPLEAATDQPGSVLRARPAVDFWEHVPAPTALLVPVVLGLAVLVSVTLGPAGRPSPVFRREGGLSRALARRSPGGVDAA